MSQMIWSGSGGGDLGDEVALAERRRSRSTISRGLDARPSRRRRVTVLRREAAVDDAAQPGVARVVHGDHRAEELADLHGQVADVDASARREDVGVPARGPHVVVAGERPVAGAAGHRLDLRLLVERDRAAPAAAWRTPPRARPRDGSRTRGRTGRCRRPRAWSWAQCCRYHPHRGPTGADGGRRGALDGGRRPTRRPRGVRRLPGRARYARPGRRALAGRAATDRDRPGRAGAVPGLRGR